MRKKSACVRDVDVSVLSKQLIVSFEVQLFVRETLMLYDKG